MEHLQCFSCGNARETKLTAKGLPRLPHGWKRRDDHAYCQGCWKKHYILRSVTFPVVGPIGCEWSVLRAALAKCWEQGTNLANWAITELAKQDVVRFPDDKKLPGMRQVYLYPQARQRFPELSPLSVVALLHTVEQRYRKDRLSVIWRAEASLTRFRYPMPFPIHNQGWKAEFGQGRIPQIEVRVGEQAFTLRLSGGPQSRRQVAAFSKIVSGEAVPGELAFYRQRGSSGDHRSGLEERKPGGGQRVFYRVMAKLTAWLPRTATEPKTDSKLQVYTGSGVFLTAKSEGRDPWAVNADHVPRWIARHRRLLGRLAQDSKYELRLPKRMGRQMADYREAATTRHYRRIDSFCHQVTAMLAAYASRQRVAEVHLDCTDKSFVPDFPWSKFYKLLAIKLDERGIGLVETGRKLAAGLDQECEAA